MASVPTGSGVQRGIYVSRDGGTSWTLVPGSDAITALSLRFSPAFAADNTFFVGTLEHGLMLSADGGNSLVTTTLSDPWVTAMAVSPDYATDHTLFVATYTGLHVSHDGGQTWQFVPTAARYEQDQGGVVASGHWQPYTDVQASCLQLERSQTASDSITFTFAGSRVAWLGPTGPDEGMATIYLDGLLQQTVNLYSASSRQQQPLWQSGTLAQTPNGHTISIVVTGTHDPRSGNSWVVFDAFSVEPYPDQWGGQRMSQGPLATRSASAGPSDRIAGAGVASASATGDSHSAGSTAQWQPRLWGARPA